jgi:predicted TIM-barrel fold metal-dependent hydrolase
MPRVDAHLHVWRAAESPIAGPATLVPASEDVPIEAARAALDAHHVARAVLVQPVFRGEDNSYVADCARAEPVRFAAVCVVDPRVPGGDERLAIWAARGCRGLRLRPRLPGEERIFGDPASDPLWAAAERLGIVVSLLAGPQHLQTIGRLAGRFAGTSIVVDHLAHPDPTEGAAGVGFRRLLALAAHPRVFVKLSGFHHFSREPFPFAECWPLVQAVYEHFGPGRLIWGSDFPHVARGGGYGENLRLVEKAIAHWPAAAREAAMGSNAARLYWPDEPSSATRAV